MKKFLSILLICVFLLSLSLCVYAEENVSEDEYYIYNIEALISNVSASGSDVYGYYVNGELTLKNKQMLFYKKIVGNTIYLCTYIYNNNEVIHCQDDYIFQNVGGYIYSNNVSCTYGRFSFYGKKNYQLINTLSSYSYLWCDMRWDSNPIENSGFIETNIPIFASKEDALGYIKGEIGIDKALNSSEVVEHAYDSERVPLPLDFKILYENSRYYLVWEYKSEDLKKLSKVKIDVINEKLYTRVHTLKDYIENPIDYKIDFSNTYAPQLANKIDITNEVNGLREYIEEKYYKHDLQFEIHFTLEGIWELSDVKILHSNKVHAVMSIKISDEGGLVTDPESYITDKDNNVLDDYYLLGPPKEINKGYISGGSGGFFGYLTSAFGLIGDNGFFGCCKAVFSCFPSFIWDLFGLGIEAAIVVFLFKLLFS